MNDNFGAFPIEKKGMASHNRENSFKDIAGYAKAGDGEIHESQGASSNLLDSPDVQKKGLLNNHEPQE